MNLKIEKYTINTDNPPNIELVEEKIISKEESKNKGKVCYKTIGNYGRLEHCLEALLDKEIASSSAESVEALLDAIGRAKKLILQNMIQAQ